MVTARALPDSFETPKTSNNYVEPCVYMLLFVYRSGAALLAPGARSGRPLQPARPPRRPAAGRQPRQRL
eukprot:9933271-Heterocapsa_arctica.AAC.1